MMLFFWSFLFLCLPHCSQFSCARHVSHVWLNSTSLTPQTEAAPLAKSDLTGFNGNEVTSSWLWLVSDLKKRNNQSGREVMQSVLEISLHVSIHDITCLKAKDMCFSFTDHCLLLLLPIFSVVHTSAISLPHTHSDWKWQGRGQQDWEHVVWGPIMAASNKNAWLQSNSYSKIQNR